MEAPTKRRNLLLAVVVVCVLVAVGDWIYSNSAEAFAAFVGTLVATFVGVGAAAYINVQRFYTESEESDRARSRLLAESLAGELFTVLDILGGKPNVVVIDPTGGGNHVPVVFAQLEPTATEEVIRVGLLGAQSSASLTQVSNLMRDYTKASDNLYPLVNQMQMDPRFVIAAHPLALEITRLKMNLVIWCTTVLYGLAAQGVEMPQDPLYRTDPRRVATWTGPIPRGPQGPPPQ